MKQPFAVVMDESYIRDAQMVDTSGLSEDEFDELDLYSPKADDLAHDIEPRHLVGIFCADTADDAIKTAAKEKRYDSRVLYAEPVLTNMPALYFASALMTVEGRNNCTAHGLVVGCDPQDAENKIKAYLPGLYAPTVGKTLHDVKIVEVSVVKQDSSWEGRVGMRVQFLIN